MDAGSDRRDVVLRLARQDEVEELSALALRSKSHWGYDAVFIEACRDELTVRAGDVERHRVTVAVERRTGQVVGFYGLVGTGSDDAELSWLFVEPEAMGRGVGRLLFDDAVRSADRAGLACFRIEADPFAAPFYEHLGATIAGAVVSHSVPGRALPLLVMDVAPAP